jgi:transcriptional regulator with XRE-family HTH domain
VKQEGQPGINQRFGKAIRRRRRELDFSQQELAERTDRDCKDNRIQQLEQQIEAWQALLEKLGGM